MLRVLGGCVEVWARLDAPFVVFAHEVSVTADTFDDGVRGLYEHRLFLSAASVSRAQRQSRALATMPIAEAVKDPLRDDHTRCVIDTVIRPGRPGFTSELARELATSLLAVIEPCTTPIEERSEPERWALETLMRLCLMRPQYLTTNTALTQRIISAIRPYCKPDERWRIFNRLAGIA